MAYEGFKKLVAKGVPPGAAANIGRKKYGKKNFQKHAAEGKKMKGAEYEKESVSEDVGESESTEKPKKRKKLNLF